MKTLTQALCLSLLLCTSVFSLAQVPVYNSNPAAAPVIFLDFDGHVVEGTAWNYGGPLVCDPSNLPAEKITEIFERVAEDYRPFTINVTTDSTRYWAAPPTRRIRVVLTVSSAWYGVAGGVAYNNSFTWGDNTPCFVFTALHNYNAKNISEAASHEAGHTLGLRHQSSYDADCNKTAEYNVGNGAGEIGWAPIMGVGYYRNLTLWHYGANPYGCTAYQDDLAIITSSFNGIGFRPDDHGDSTASATVATFVNNQFAVDGIIEKPSDADVIKFTLPYPARIQLVASPYAIAVGNAGSDIDLQVDLMNSTQTVVGSYNPADELSASIDTLLANGTYYLRVQGKGNIYAPNYASLGSYSLKAINVSAATLPVQKLELKGAVENGRHNLTWELVASEKPVSQVLEVSANGVNFTTLATMPASELSYNTIPVAGGIQYYRLKVVFGKGYSYSNITALRTNGGNSKPYLIGNATAASLTIASPSAFHYTLHDFTGRILNKGLLTTGMNTVSVAGLPGGLYLIRYSNGGETTTEKFMKQ